MFFRQKNNQNPYGTFDEQFVNPNMSNMYPNFEVERLQHEIKENRRRINNLAKRIIRLENYLRIRDTSDYVVDEDTMPFWLLLA